MNGKVIIFLVLMSLIGSCTVKENLCEAVSCAAPTAYLKLKFISTANSSDLFSDSSVYSLNDLKIFSTETGNVPFKVDSTSTDHIKYISIFSNGNETITVKLGSGKPDIIKIESRIIKKDCCANLEITQLLLNDDVICKNCDGYETLVIKK